MADREQNSKPGMNQQQQKPKQPVVGRDVPDESKEHHTEIAVEAGHHDDHKENEKKR